MQDLSEILGNEKLKKRLSADIRGGTLSHAYIIEAPYGCGKHRLALSLAAAFSCENNGQSETAGPIPCLDCPACRKILSGRSPDVTIVKREEGKASIGVDIIRSLRSDVSLVPNDLETKVYIIEDAHTMNIQAQNAFLLTLEEPPKYVVFLLLCEDAGAMLETVRSRAPVIRMSPLPSEVVTEELVKSYPDAARLMRENKEELAEIVKLSGGSLGYARDLLDAKTREPLLVRRRAAKEFFALLGTSRKGRRAVEFLNLLPQKRDELSDTLGEIELAARDILVSKKTDNASLGFFADPYEALELAGKYKATTLMRIITAAEDAKARLLRNANVRLTIYSFAAVCGLI